VGNVSMNVYAKFRCASLHIKKALGIFWTLTELIPTSLTRHETSSTVCLRQYSDGFSVCYSTV